MSLSFVTRKHMRTMEPTRKQRWRVVEAARVRKGRVILGYVEKRYSEVYREASGFFDFLNSKYPTKKDLRKTNEYELLKTCISDEPAKKYYAKRTKKTTSTTTTFVDTMELTIPLITTNTTDSEPTLAEQTTTNHGVDNDISDIVPTFNQELPNSTNHGVDNDISDIVPMFNQEIPNSILDEIMSELRGDPHLDEFFENLSDDFFDHEELICS